MPALDPLGPRVAAAPDMELDLVIGPRSGWRPIDWRELLAYRDLLRFLVWRDIKALYAQTVLGFGWAVIRPLFSMLVFTIIFGKLVGMPSDGVPYAAFSYTALVPWMYFTTSMTGSTSSLVTNSSLLSKVYFPRLVIPMTPILAGLVDFSIALAVLGALLAYYGIVPPPAIVVLPLLVLLMVTTSLGVGMWLSALAVQYRDIKHGAPFLSQLLMYAAPVVWPVSLITEKWPEDADAIRLVYGLYPMAGVIEGFRSALLGTHPIPWDMMGAGALSAVALCITGAFYFRRVERSFADVA